MEGPASGHGGSSWHPHRCCSSGNQRPYSSRHPTTQHTLRLHPEPVVPHPEPLVRRRSCAGPTATFSATLLVNLFISFLRHLLPKSTCFLNKLKATVSSKGADGMEFPATVKWGKQRFTGLILYPGMSADELQQKLQSLTGVPVLRLRRQALA